ncbi:hypothetical protein KCP73_01605 [Salmonella enterica subsp. enterica]|nr:hypothetical protein KCP73_01605 [Salmonella enterica subsp. enterica]
MRKRSFIGVDCHFIFRTTRLHGMEANGTGRSGVDTTTVLSWCISGRAVLK